MSGALSPAGQGLPPSAPPSQALSYQLNDLTLRPAGLSAAAPAVLRRLNMAFKAGETVALIGPSGAGKTSLLNVLALAQAPTHAAAFKRTGLAPYALAARRLHALRKTHFYAPQLAPLPPRQRVINAVMAGALPHWGALKSLREWVASSHAQQAFDALQAFDLGEKLYARVDTLSGGERQRVGLARALVAQRAARGQMQAWFLDEPLSALDPALGERALSVLLAQARAHGILVVASLHHVALARSQFGRIVGLRHGEIAFDAPSELVTDAMIDALYAGQTQGAPSEAVLMPLDAAPALIRCT